jgi:hypothetical protein
VIFYGTVISSAFLDEIKNGNFEDDDFYYDTEIETEIDTTNTWTDEDYIIEDEQFEEEIEEIEINTSENEQL